MKLSGKVFNVGDMHTQVTLKRRIMTTDAGGYQTPGYQVIAIVWTKWVNLFGPEIWSMQSVTATNPATVTVRYRSDIDPTCVIDKGGLIYEILSMDNIQEHNEYFEMKVSLEKAG